MALAPDPLFYLLQYLEDEFAALDGIKVRLVQKAVTRRSPDLPQDYDAEAKHLHKTRGVLVKKGSYEVFFPEVCGLPEGVGERARLIDEVRDRL